MSGQTELIKNKAVPEVNRDNLLQDLIEVMADWVDSEDVMFEQIHGEFYEPEERDESELHIRMARAAMNEYLKTVKKNERTVGMKSFKELFNSK